MHGGRNVQKKQQKNVFENGMCVANLICGPKFFNTFSFQQRPDQLYDQRWTNEIRFHI